MAQAKRAARSRVASSSTRTLPGPASTTARDLLVEASEKEPILSRRNGSVADRKQAAATGSFDDRLNRIVKNTMSLGFGNLRLMVRKGLGE